MSSNVSHPAGVHDWLAQKLKSGPIAGGRGIASYCGYSSGVPTTPACAWWNRPEEDNSSGKLESTHPSRTSVKSDQVFFGVE